jgi:hypothetical protein
MPKTSAISVRVPDNVKAAAEKAAAADHRSLASLVEKLLTEHLKAKGYLRHPGSDEGLRPAELTSDNDGWSKKGTVVDRSEEARLRAEANFKKKKRQTQEGEKAWAEHLAAGNAADANRAKLKEQRLARDVAEQAPKGKSKLRKPSMDLLAQEEKERGVLPTHRQVPIRTARMKEHPSK